MSLDVYLTVSNPIKKEPDSGIFIREAGQTKQVTEAEWYQRNPDREPVIFRNEEVETNEVYSDNITHNLNGMAAEAGIYEALWRPEEINITHAYQLIIPLTKGVVKLKEEPEHFKTFNPENGWGNYEGLVRFVEDYLKACIEYPEANVNVSR